MRKISSFVLVIWILFASCLRGETIREYSVQIRANSNRTVHVKENVFYDYQSDYEEGFVRILPLIAAQSRFQLTTDADKADVETLRITMDNKPLRFAAQEKFDAEHGPYLWVLTGVPGHFVTGAHRYELRYTLSNAFHPAHGGSDLLLRWELPGDERNAPIDRLSLDVTLPTDWNRSTVTLGGKIGNSPLETSKITWTTPHRFTVRLQAVPPHTPIVIDVLRPNPLGPSPLYALGSVSMWKLLMYGLPFLLLGLYLWWLGTYKKQTTPIMPKDEGIPVRYAPPEGLDFLQAIYLSDDGIGPNAIFPAIIDLVHRGYVRIKRTLEGFELQKIRGTDASKLGDGQRYLLNGILFPLESQTFPSRSVDAPKRRMLREKLAMLNTKLSNWAIESGYYRADFHKVRHRYVTMAVIFQLLIATVLSGCLVLLVGHPDPIHIIQTIIFFVPVASLFAFVLFLFIQAWYRRSIGWGLTGIAFLWFALFLGKLLFYPACRSLYEVLFCPHFWVFAIIEYRSLTTYLHLRAYTPKGAQIDEAIRGFKEFVSTVERDRLSRMLQEDPFYTDRFLPYAIVADYTGAWGELYDELKLEIASWFREETDTNSD
ncbi:DUF2207 domain-containing protein [Nitratifractor sp.]